MTGIREELRFLLKHSAVYGVGNIFSRAVAFVLLPLYTRYLTPADYGVLELIDATSAMVGVVIGLGVTNSISRFYYEEDERGRKRLLATVYILTLIVGAAVCIPLMFAAPVLATRLLDHSRYTAYFRVGFAALVAGTLADVGFAQLRLRYKSSLFVTLSILSLVLGVALNVFFIVFLRMGALGVLVTSLITKLAMGVPLSIVVLSRTGLHFDGRRARELLAYSLPLIPSALGATLTIMTERYFLKAFGSLADTGLFGLARKIAGGLHLLLTGPFIATFLPRRFEIARRENAPAVLARVYDAFFVGLLVPATFVALFAREVLMVMTTPSYYRAAEVVPILLIETLALGTKYHVELGILLAKKTQYYFVVNTLASALNVVLDYYLIMWFGLWGAAFATLAGTLLQVVLLYVVSQRYYRIPFVFPRHFAAVCVAGVMVASAHLVPGGLAGQVPVKAVLFAGFLWLLARRYQLTPANLRNLLQFRQAGEVSAVQ